MAMGHDTQLMTLLLEDPLRMNALNAVARLDLTDRWIGASFVRDALGDHLHGSRRSVPHGDVDVVWFDAHNIEVVLDRQIECRLRGMMPGLQWSVKNQARMHQRIGDAPYRSVAEAMRHWPETATAVAVASDGKGSIRINAPFGLRISTRRACGRPPNSGPASGTSTTSGSSRRTGSQDTRCSAARRMSCRPCPSSATVAPGQPRSIDRVPMRTTAATRAQANAGAVIGEPIA